MFCWHAPHSLTCSVQTNQNTMHQPPVPPEPWEPSLCESALRLHHTWKTHDHISLLLLGTTKGSLEVCVKTFCSFSSLSQPLCHPPFFFPPPPSLSVCTVMTWSCLLTPPQDSLNDPIRKRKYNKASVAVVCFCLGLWLSPPRPGSVGL